MTTNEFGGRMHDNIYAMLEWLHQIRCSQRVIDDNWQAVFMRNIGNRLEIQRVQAWIAQRLRKDGFCMLVDGAAEIVGIAAIHEAYVNAKFGQGVVEEIISTTIEARRGDNLIASSSNIENCQRLCRLSGAGRQSTNATFEGSHAAFKSIL